MHNKSISELDRLVLELAVRGMLPRSSPHTCPYLPDQQALEEGFVVEKLHSETYHELMNLGFRRSGKVLYRPRCESCSSCIQLRVPVHDFAPSRSQRRVFRKNSDLSIRLAPPHLDEEKQALYTRYLTRQHPDSQQGDDPESLRDFLYSSCVDTVEATYHDAEDRLVAVSLLDVSSRSLSSVYHFFDPEHAKRSLGVHSVLAEIELCKDWGIPYYYLGYWVPGCGSMAYKADYYPHEILVEDTWQRVEKNR